MPAHNPPGHLSNSSKLNVLNHTPHSPPPSVQIHPLINPELRTIQTRVVVIPTITTILALRTMLAARIPLHHLLCSLVVHFLITIIVASLTLTLAFTLLRLARLRLSCGGRARFGVPEAVVIVVVWLDRDDCAIG